MYSYGSPHMAAQKQDDQHERTFSSYVRIQVVVLKTCLGRWTIGRSGERGSGISVLPARYDDDDDDDDKPLDDDIRGILENKTNATSHPNTGSLKSAIEEGGNRTSEESIYEACKSLQMRFDTIIEKKMVAILSKFTVLCLSYFLFIF